jgi:hypothetical protein
MSVIYKIYIDIINKRLTDFLENNNILSDSQAGFRRNRNTWNKIWQLRNLIEHQNLNKKPIHIIYLDLAKAYDSVEHWAIKQILSKYGFNKEFTKIIQDICKNNTAEIITAYGNTSKIEIGRGLPQGSPISPILFDLFLDPLLQLIEENQLGIQIEEENYNVLAYADDMALVADRFENIQTMLTLVSEFCNYYGIEINYDSNEKSVYTTNENKNYQVNFRDRFNKKCILPKLTPNFQ